MKPLFIILILFISTTFMYSQISQCDQLVKEGFDYLKQGNLSYAIDKYIAAIKINPDKIEAQYGLGVAYSATCLQNGGYCNDAISHFLKANKIKKGYREIYYNLGVCFIKIFNYKEALVYLDKAIEQKNDDGEYYYNRGFAKIHLGYNNEGCNDLKKALGVKIYSCSKSPKSILSIQKLITPLIKTLGFLIIAKIDKIT